MKKVKIYLAALLTVTAFLGSLDAAALSLGDIDGNDTIDSSDASSILRAYAYASTNNGKTDLTEAQKAAADVNKDGIVDASDASSILQFYSFVSTGGTASFEEFLFGSEGSGFSEDIIPEYTDKPYAIINNNMPYFKEGEYVKVSFEKYSELDDLGRCGSAYACIGKDLMPTEPRGDISSVKPSGWHSVIYDNVEGGSLYNRCHLIAFQLTGENANECNLITGTRYFNTEAMLPFENQTADYIRKTNNHVLYRVTPVFHENDLVCKGVLMEAYSVEDNGSGVCFNVFCYNIQPDIVIDYATGDSKLKTEGDPVSMTYILNTNTKRFHYPSCPSCDEMNPKNKEEFTGTRDELIKQDYIPCGNCKP